ncbi:MAG: tyrosine-type recombinase/integrase [Planctomycetes bacterium]|nr:tyrosine-type recombinase/integrase [Planctomycetota bacterium]
MGRSTDESRRAWCIAKSVALRDLKAAIESGAATLTQTPIADAMASYYRAKETTLQPSTLTVYREATKPFTAWAADKGIAMMEAVTQPKLVEFQSWFVARPAQAQAKGKGVRRGARVIGKRKRSPSQLNKCIRALRTVLNELRRAGKTPALHSDSIKDSLRFVKWQKPLPHFVEASEIRTLLAAALRHDNSTFDFARRGKVRQASPHSRPPVAPMIAVALLSGMRFGELQHLTWEQVKADEIRLDATDTKTGHGRKIDLAPTPALSELFSRLKLQAGECPFVFGTASKDNRGRVHYAPVRRTLVEAERKRLWQEFGAPRFTWHDLRRTCGTFLCCAPSIFGAASAFLAAKRLGHSVKVSERHYLGQVKVAPDARTLEDAFGCADVFKKLCGPASASNPLAATA